MPNLNDIIYIASFVLRLMVLTASDLRENIEDPPPVRAKVKKLGVIQRMTVRDTLINIRDLYILCEFDITFLPITIICAKHHGVAAILGTPNLQRPLAEILRSPGPKNGLDLVLRRNALRCKARVCIVGVGLVPRFAKVCRVPLFRDLVQMDIFTDQPQPLLIIWLGG